VFTTIAMLAYASGRDSVARGDLAAARGQFVVATALDPGLAIYSRQLGTLQLLMGETDEAISSLHAAIRRNNNDDLAWRLLGIAHGEAGNEAQAIGSLERAVELQRSDATNMLLLARAVAVQGDHERARHILEEVVQAWPTIVAAPEWHRLAGSSHTIDLVRAAFMRWLDGVPSPEVLSSQPILLAVMNGTNPSDMPPLFRLATSTLEAAYVETMACSDEASIALGAATSADRRQPTYWELVVRQAALESDDPQSAIDIHEIMTHNSVFVDPEIPDSLLNPLLENGLREASSDVSGYRSWPIEWPPTRWDLPSPSAGFARWHLDPALAAVNAGLDATLRDCL
jgi:tetratricopeptide (TPR) repeat protein